MEELKPGMVKDVEFTSVDDDEVEFYNYSEYLKPTNEVKLMVKKIEDKVKHKKEDLIRSMEISEKNRNNQKKKNNRALAATPLDYQNRIYLWTLEGWTTKKIVDTLVGEYGVRSTYAAEKLVKMVRQSYTLIEKEDIDELKAKYLEMYSDLYRRSIEKKDMATARNILDSVVKLQGLITNKVEGKIENTFTVDFN